MGNFLCGEKLDAVPRIPDDGNGSILGDTPPSKINQEKVNQDQKVQDNGFLFREKLDAVPPPTDDGNGSILGGTPPSKINQEKVNQDQKPQDNGNKDNIIVSTDVDINQAGAFVCEVVGEHHPVLLQTGLSLEQRVGCLKRTFSEQYLKKAEGLSTVAWKDGAIVGAVLTMDWKDSQGSIPLGEDMDEFKKMWGMCDEMWADSKGGKENIKPGEWAHFVGLAVDPKFITGPVPSKLLLDSLKFLEKKGYHGALLETNFTLDHALAKRVGFKNFVSVNYKRYRDDNGRASFAALKSPHNSFSLWEVRLDTLHPEDFAEKKE